MADPMDEAGIFEGIRSRLRTGAVRITQHAAIEMADEAIAVDEVLFVLESNDSVVLEDYAEHKRGACCLVGGKTEASRHLHVVCTTANPTLIIITVYVPLPPKWMTPTERGTR